MKKVFANHAECAHVWAAQSQPEGRASRIFFEGPTIYSYGRHYPIASFVKPGIVLFNCDGYSVSTAKHRGHVWRALRGLNAEIIEVPTACVTGGLRSDAMQSFHDRRAAALNKAARSRKYTDTYLADAATLEADAQRYALAFDMPAPVFAEYDRDALLAKAKAEAKANREANAERERKLAALKAAHDTIYPLVLAFWRRHEMYTHNGVSFSLSGYHDKPTALRLSRDGASVETSRGAEVPLADARKLWGAIEQCQRYKRGMIADGYGIGAFRLREIRADGTAIVGCHTLTFEETSAFAKAQGWAE